MSEQNPLTSLLEKVNNPWIVVGIIVFSVVDLLLGTVAQQQAKEDTQMVAESLAGDTNKALELLAEEVNNLRLENDILALQLENLDLRLENVENKKTPEPGVEMTHGYSIIERFSPTREDLRTLAKQKITQVVKQQRKSVESCHSNAMLSENRLISGDILVLFKVDPSGFLSLAQVESNTTGSSRLGACITDIMKDWTFPDFPTKESVSVTYPFHFVPNKEGVERLAKKKAKEPSNKRNSIDLQKVQVTAPSL